MVRSCHWNTAVLVVLVASLLPPCLAQARCYPAGGVAGIVIATFVVTVVVVGLSLAAAWRIRRRKKALKEKAKDVPTVPEKIPGDFAFDNPYFRDQEEDETDAPDKAKDRSFGVNRNPLRSSKQSDLSTKGKKSKGGKHFIFGGGVGGVGFGGGKKQRAFDDSCLPVEPERTVVSLRGHDFTGLGFNICGNMRDGILVKDVLHRGPASESGRIKAGDKILNVTVSFTNMVYEDALTILSYASPYDVQLELERIPDKSRAMHTSPATSKRLASCSFSSGGQKLFHPLYRSQSIDDLTQIDKDTFPSHGIGPRRSQSVGVAAHKLAAHFKHSDAKLDDKDRSPTAVILSTTGSLNEKMLANVMVEGGLQKSGLQWEKRFEDTLDSESSETNRTSGLGDSKRVTPALTNKSHSLAKDSVSSAEGDRTDTSDEIPISPHHYAREKHQYCGPGLSRHKPKGDQYSSEQSVTKQELKSRALKTTAQVHHYNSCENRANTLSEASHAIWHLDQSIKDGDSGASVSDLDSSNAYSTGGGDDAYSRARRRKEKEYSTHSSSSEAQRNINPKKDVSSKRDYDGDSDVSRDSLELGDKKLSGKRRNRRSSSLGDLAQLEEAVNAAATVNENVNNTMQQEVEKHQHFSGNVHDKRAYQKSVAKSVKNGEKNNLSKSARNGNSRIVGAPNEMDYETDYNSNANSQAPHGNSSLGHMCSKEQKLERLVNSRVSSPKFSIQSTSNSSHGRGKESPCLKPQCHHAPVSTNPGGQEKSMPNRNFRKTARNESPRLVHKMSDRPSYNEKYEINNSPNYVQYYGSNNNNIISNKTEDNKSDSLVQHNRPIYQQNSSLSHRQMTGFVNTVDGGESKKPDLNNEVVTSSHHQFLRKAANPAGMFTQINPFHQPTRNKTNVVFKPWSVKEGSQNDIKVPLNGNTTFYTSVLPKQGQVTACDSVGHQHVKMDNSQDFVHRIDNNGSSKTVMVSSVDAMGSRSSLRVTADSASSMNYRLPRK